MEDLTTRCDMDPWKLGDDLDVVDPTTLVKGLRHVPLPQYPDQGLRKIKKEDREIWTGFSTTELIGSFTETPEKE